MVRDPSYGVQDASVILFLQIPRRKEAARATGAWLECPPRGGGGASPVLNGLRGRSRERDADNRGDMTTVFRDRDYLHDTAGGG